MTSFLEARGVAKSFGGKAVLQGVDLHVEEGEVFALVGPSGVGKTTFLRCVDFLAHPDAGTILYDGREAPADAAGLLALRRRIAMVPQNPFLFRGSVSHNVSYGLCVRGIESPALERETEKALGIVGLQGLADAPATRLSAGEAQRVAFARAVVVGPELLLLDECTANLDPANVALLERAIAAYHEESDATVVIVTHNLFQAKRLADRVGLLLGGRIVETDDVDAFFENPKDPRTRAFVGGEMPY